MKKPYSIEDIVSLLIRKLWLMILLTVIGGGIAFTFSKFVLPLQYSSHITPIGIFRNSCCFVQ